MFRLLPTSLLLLSLAACGASPHADAHHEPLDELVTYSVPGGSAERLSEALNRAFQREGGNVARATAGPAGALVVVGPGAVQKGVATLISGLEATPEPAPRNVALTYWVVRGIPGTAADGAGLDALTSTLDALEQVDGPMSFALHATRRLVSLDGQQGRTEDRGIDIEQIVSVLPGGEGLIADLEVGVPGAAKTNTRVALTPGQTLVLAQAGAVDEAGTSGQLYVLVRALLP